MPKGIYQRSSIPIEDRLWRYISPEPNTGCWLWDGSLTDQGYAQLYAGPGEGRPRKAHIISYKLYRGNVPSGLELDHTCRVRCCVNPDHLEPVPHVENVRRGDAGKTTAIQQQSRTHCANGHPLDDGIRNNRGTRVCLICGRDATRRFRNRKRPMS